MLNTGLNILLVILIIAAVILAILYFLGNKLQKRQLEQQQMLDAKTMQSEQQRDAELLAAVVENSEIACATDEVNEVYDQQIQYYTSMAGMYGMGLADYAAMMGMDEDGFRTEVRKT